MNHFEREKKYVVLKKRDIYKYLSDKQLGRLHKICRSIEEGRAADGRKPIDCVIVENDWPMYEDTWKSIEDFYLNKED